MNNLLEYKLDLVAAHLGVYKIEDVAVVMRRQHIAPEDGRVVDVIDFYPEWNAFGTYGKMKVCHEYMDDEWQVKRFEKYAGVSLDSLPIYDGQTALVRRFGQTHRCETAVRPFRLMVQPRTDDNGNNAKTLILRYLPSPEARRHPQPSPQQEVAAPAAPPTKPTEPAKAADQPTDWLARAGEAVDSFDFDTCMSKALEYFATGAHVEKARTGLFGNKWLPDNRAAYIAGLKAYANGRANNGLFDKAKASAIEAYRAALPR